MAKPPVEKARMPEHRAATQAEVSCLVVEPQIE
jgi:hypothetical protein